MQLVRQLGSGFLYGLVSVALVVGGLSLALAESYIVPHPTVTPSLPAVPPTLTAPSFDSATSASVPPPTQTPPAPIACRPPAGWVPIIVQPGDTLAALAATYGSTPEGLAAANCLLTQNLAPGYSLYVPYAPAASVPCGPPLGWEYGYVVQPGDTLSQIAEFYDTTVSELMSANCKTGSEIFVGDRLWVPVLAPGLTFIPPFGTPTSTGGETGVPTEPLTSTPLPFTATVMPTDTSALPAYSASPTPTITAFPTATP